MKSAGARITGAVVLVLLDLAVAAVSQGAPATDHPRLLVRSVDLPRLRSWAVDTNPVYANGIKALAEQGRLDMDSGNVPGLDTGGYTYTDYPTEMYAELFAFMSLVGPVAERADYAQRARTLLMFVIDHALLGPAAGVPFRDPEFAVNDRSRWQGEAFGLTVDWIYPSLSATDKGKIVTVFQRWIAECQNAAVTAGPDHPVPVGVTNDPVLTDSAQKVRWAANNYFTAHMRNIGLMAMSLDAADDPGNLVRGAVANATGAWLYVIDYTLRHDSRGGLLPEGFEYGPQTLAYMAQFLLALRTAGFDDPTTYGPQVVLTGNPFWEQFVTGAFHSLSPAPATSPTSGEQVYLPAWFGDGQNYWAPDLIAVFGSLGVYDSLTGNGSRLAALRWFETNLPTGGAAALGQRARDGNFYVNAILYFLLFDPTAAAPADPRPGLPLTFFAPGLGRILARTGWDAAATWFSYKLSWNQVDHQNGDGNQFELYRKGEWLTKERTGYDLDYGGSNNHNTLALENGAPAHNDPDTYRNINWRLGSQWAYVASGDPQLLATSFGSDYVYAQGDATNLYNSAAEGSTDVAHASRSIVWLAPDHVVVYDRAASLTAGRFKRFWLNAPGLPAISGQRATVSTASGQRLFVTSVLPVTASLSAQAFLPLCAPCGTLATDEPMGFQLAVEAPGGPTTTRFLHVLQGADAGVAPDAVTLVQSASGTPFSGAVVRNTAVLFPVDLTVPFASVTYAVPVSTTAQRITGLSPGAGYSVVSGPPAAGQVPFTITPGGVAAFADSGGVLALPQISISIDDVSVPKPSAGTASAAFTVTLSSPSAAAVTVAFATADGTATAGSDYQRTAGTLVFQAGETSQTIGVPVLADRVAGGTRTFVVNLSSPGGALLGKGQGIGSILNPNAAGLSIDDVSVQRSATSTVDAVFTVTLSPTSGAIVTVDYATADGSGLAGTDYAAASGTLTFPAGVSTRPIAVTTLPRPLSNGPKTFRINLTNATGGPTIAFAQGTGTILSPGTFYSVTPCRLVDTRYPAAPLGGPALAPSAERTFALSGVCGIPPTAKAVSVNLTVTQPGAQGNVRLYPAATPLPLVSSVNYVAGQTRANNAVVPLGAGGAIAAHCVQGSGTVHLILDVNGYFE